MSRLDRRTFLARTAALASIAKLGLGRNPLTKRNLGVQLYTVRNIISKDPATVLKAIQDIGYAEVEPTYANLHEIWPALKQTSLQPISVHIDFAIYKEGGSRLDQALTDVKKLGSNTQSCPTFHLRIAVAWTSSRALRKCSTRRASVPKPWA